MTNEALIKLLRKHHACPQAIAWVGQRTAQQAWDQCPHGDWLLWVADRVGIDRKLLVLAACGCARLALEYVRPGEDRPRLAIETAEAWTRGEATREELKSVADATDAAAVRATSAASSQAALASAYVSATAAYYATWNVTYVNAARSAAYAADAAAYAAADTVARNTMRRDCADAVRKVIAFEDVAACAGRGRDCPYDRYRTEK
jgi:hypothetical protein